ncbi:MAG: hypothetical protein ACYC6N_11395 [Pirellulaceae bacterium]
MPLIAVMLWAVAGQLEASILTPDQAASDIEKLLDDVVSESFSLSSALCAGGQVAVPLDREAHDSQQPSEVLISDITFPGGTSSGTSSSTGGAGGTSSFPANCVAAVSLLDTELIAWVGGEQRFGLPQPPENELLRPPQTLS